MSRSRRCRWLLVALLAAPGPGALPAQAQQAAEAGLLDAPVRYETDFPSPEFHRGRREEVLSRLPQNALAVVFSAPEHTRQNDVSYEYRQSSNLLYLTGTHEAGSVLLLAPGGIDVDGRRVRELLFVPPRDPATEVWDGRRFGTDRAVEQLGVEHAVEWTRFEEILVPLLEDGEHVVMHVEIPDGVERGTELARQLEVFVEHVEPVELEATNPRAAAMAVALGSGVPAQLEALREGGVQPSAYRDPRLRSWAEAFAAASSYDEWARTRTELLAGHSLGGFLRWLLEELRAVKTDEELELLRRAIDITAEAHREVMQRVEPGWAEYEIEALVEYTFMRNGAEHTGFPSIVGSGENSVILHYESNRRTTEPGDLVVIDIGAEYHGYTADVTRTVPVSGRYTPEQRAIYEIVYRAQEAGIQAARAGNPFSATHQAASRALAEGLAELGLIDGPNDVAGLHRFFMHGTSHYLGLDVHDVGMQGPLQPGTVITVEPGLYIAPAEDIDPKWWNIGVRIEDDVLVTEGEPVLLSDGVPRQIDEVEALMARRPVSE
ncbi:MAG TPA: aminopeptidase P N-terminal domain-containing protein [Longimicrobiales bacterium]|nr:aminopeptidase P N-terminal domain-containing protein [Longimicrobiales bacterium]